MVDEAGHAKLIDFGLSRLLDSVSGTTGFMMSTVYFSIRWCAPELVSSDNAQVTKSTDVYSYASTVLAVRIRFFYLGFEAYLCHLQLLTGDLLYSSQRERTVLITVNKQGHATETINSNPLLRVDQQSR